MVLLRVQKIKPGGKILVISFHSIEDRIVKYFFLTFQKINLDRQGIFPENKTSDIVYLMNIKMNFLDLQKKK